MASRGVSVEDKVGNWKQAFDLIAPELHTPGMLDLLATLQSNEAMRDLPLYIQIARIVNANQRAAATIAALLVGQGIKPTGVNYGDDE